MCVELRENVSLITGHQENIIKFIKQKGSDASWEEET